MKGFKPLYAGVLVLKNVDWKKVWEVAKPIVLKLLLAALAGGAAGHYCGGEKAEAVVKSHLVAQK